MPNPTLVAGLCVGSPLQHRCFLLVKWCWRVSDWLGCCCALRPGYDVVESGPPRRSKGMKLSRSSFSPIWPTFASTCSWDMSLSGGLGECKTQERWDGQDPWPLAAAVCAVPVWEEKHTNSTKELTTTAHGYHSEFYRCASHSLSANWLWTINGQRKKRCPCHGSACAPLPRPKFANDETR